MVGDLQMRDHRQAQEGQLQERLIWCYANTVPELTADTQTCRIFIMTIDAFCFKTVWATSMILLFVFWNVIVV
jgi:hypothetical protein